MTSAPLAPRAQRAFALLAFVCLVAFQTGCGFLSAAANPKVAWAVNDPAPMTVVVRRADAAEKTATEVDRLLTSTPAGENAAWLGQSAPSVEDATAKMKSLREHPLYRATQARIVAAEVWSDSLMRLAVAKPNAAPLSPLLDAKKGDKPGKSGKPEKKASKKKAPAAAETPNAPAAPQGASLLAALDPELGAACEEILHARREVAALRARATQLSADRDAKTTPLDRKATLKKEIADVEKGADDLEKKIAPKQKELVARAKAAAAKASPELRDRLGPVAVNLRQAVEDASIANGAAAVRYPMALPTLLDSTKAMVPVIVADIVQEQTGKRPTMDGLQPAVSLDGGNVQITLNGLTAADMGKLSLDKLTTLTVERTQAWVGHALSLPGAIGGTRDTLSFEADLLDALLGGLRASGWSAPPAPAMPEAA